MQIPLFPRRAFYGGGTFFAAIFHGTQVFAAVVVRASKKGLLFCILSTIIFVLPKKKYSILTFF
ncbi:hypothetical protein OBV_28350 [Oscillibacter valericigenes Sjm18-20]|nr:hypothetical protein OBV_28350 [Oscillibacter valericigenes Sjm18-20]